MSKRFGRNQKRRMREALFKAELDAFNLRCAYDMTFELVKSQRAKISILEEVLGDVEQIMSSFSASLPPKEVEADRMIGDTIELPDYQPLSATPQFFTGDPARPHFKIDRLKIMVASVKDLPDRTGKHVIVKFDGMQWGYAIDDAAIHATPRDILVRRLSKNLAEVIAQELKEAA